VNYFLEISMNLGACYFTVLAGFYKMAYEVQLFFLQEEIKEYGCK
jgi:hypothetical protein